MSKLCIFCGAEIHAEAAFCHVCAQSQVSKEISRAPKRTSKISLTVTGSIIFVVLSLFIVTLSMHSGMTADKPEAIAYNSPDQPTSFDGEVTPMPIVQPNTSVAPIPPVDSEYSDEPVISAVPSPVHESEPAEEREPVRIQSDNAELAYTDGEETYRLVLTFYRSDGVFPDAVNWMEVSTHAQGREFTYSQLFVEGVTAGKRANENFLEKVSSFYVEAIPVDTSAVMETSDPLVNEEDLLALRSARVYFDAYNGTNIIRWTITMKNGDVLSLQHSLSATELRRYTGNEGERLLTGSQLEKMKWADAETLRNEISTVADAVAYLDQFDMHFYDALDSDFKLDVESMLNTHRTEATGTDVFTAFVGWCLSDDYPDAKYLIASGAAKSFTWIYHGLLLPIEGGYRVVCPSSYSTRWNCVWGFDSVEVASLDDLVSNLVLRHDGMADDSGLPIYHVYAINVGASNGASFWQDGDYLITNSVATELYRK
jgi:hypothetical protein